EGIIASTVTRYGEEINVRVLFSEKNRGNLAVLDQLMISDKRGNLIPLHKIALVKKEPGPKDRKHLDFQRAITITADVDTKIITSVKVNKLLRNKFKDLSLNHPGYRLVFGGEERDTRESMESLFISLIIAIFCIFAILVTLFNSLTKPFLVMLSIPFGFVGVILGFTLHGKALGFLAMIGSIGLVGVVVNASIVMVTFIDQLRKEGGLSFHECLIKGSSLRLRPVVLTTITTVSALFPTAYGIGGWDPILVPMTLALAWGLMFGTLSTLILVPCSYAALDDISKYIKEIWKSKITKLEPEKIEPLK
ncbi:MAG: efflux RND transporter permease subunit, partial [Pseudomonadota bacterium]